LISTVTVAFALIAGTAGVADAAKSSAERHVLTTRCGTTYTPACTKPKISNKSPDPLCVDTGIAYKLPTISFKSNAGLKKIKILLGTKVIKTVTFTGQGPVTYQIKRLPVPTVDLVAGAHAISVQVTDLSGKTVKKTLNFSVCKATPAFTG
jgi:hypothetical protein